jgi:acetyl coenzyme A synthetase (ADP forming)-like protein
MIHKRRFDSCFISKTYEELRRVFEPESVAIIGASDKIDKVGGAITRNVLNSNYGGKVYLVNPNLPRIFGRKAYSSVEELPEDVDLVEIIVPASLVPETMRRLAGKNVAGAVIISAGFAESGNSHLQSEVVEIARRLGIRVIGPNCFGIINTDIGLDLTFTFTNALRGSIAFISQSGAMCCGTLDWAYNREIGFSKFINLGNECDVDISDVLAYLSLDPHTKVICAYVEGVKDGRKLIEVGRLVARNKPIIVLKAGSSEAGARASLSHTGSIAGSENVVDAGLRQACMLRVNDVDDIFDAAIALMNQPLPEGDRVGIISNAGGLAVLVSDWCSKFGLQIPVLPSEVQRKIKNFLPPIASTSNPIDMTGGADYECYRNVLDTVLAEDTIDCVICIFVSQGLVTAAQPARAVVEVAGKYSKPVLAFWMGERSTREGVEILRRGRIPCYPSPSRVAMATSAIVYYSKLRKTLNQTNIPS